ncbi:MAG: helix-turn-helix transcriptional regulator [Litorimonas sp.]
MSYHTLTFHQLDDIPFVAFAPWNSAPVEYRFETLRFSHGIPSKAFEPSLIAEFNSIWLQSRHASQHDSLVNRVRHEVSKVLGDGLPTLSTIASKLGIGPRTLQRRLSATGHSFQGIVDIARKSVAQQLLRETQYSLAEIALLTGFSEQSGFTRAFRRWAGQTPRSYRLDVSSGFDRIRQNSRPSRRKYVAPFSMPITLQTKERET